MKMVKYVCLITDLIPDGVSGSEALERAWESQDLAGIAAYEFELPEDSGELVATMYARGLFFTHDWSMDGTSSAVIRLGLRNREPGAIPVLSLFGFSLWKVYETIDELRI